jgi:RNA polymerase sigma factor (sigma-70 family)
MTPPPAEPFASRIFLGPALRTQSDGRLVKLVREGYETAFEEIVRRYRKPLDRFAATFVGNRSEDVTQDALSKALLALRGSENEIELRPWLYRIVRNTALNDIRDRPPTVEQLEETLAGGASAAVEAERREEMTELIDRLRALPEPQRAAIVMRELEGLSHDEIAAALGVSGGAARQAIYRARATLRNGLGLLIPLPLLRMLFEHGAAADAASAGATAAAGVAGAASAGGGATLGGIGAGTALKAGLATVLVAGSVGAAGVAFENQRSGNGGPDPAEAAVSGDPRSGEDGAGAASGSSGPGSGGEREPGDDRDDSSGGPGSGERDDDDRGRGSDDDRGGEDRSGPGGGDGDDDSGRGRGRGGDDDDDDRSGSSTSGSGRKGSGHSGSSGSGSSGSSDDSDDLYVAPAVVESDGDDDSSGSGGSDDSDGDSDSSGSGSGDDD